MDHALRRRRWLGLLALLLLAGAGLGAYFFWAPRRTALPVIPTAGLDAEVVAAIDQARAGVEARPSSAAAWGRLGMVLFAHDMYADCGGVLAEAERLDPKDARWPYFHGLALILQNPDEGIALLERAAAIPPHSLTVRLRLAEQYVKLDRLEEAEALFGELLVEYPDHPRALLGRGQILARHGRWQEALAPLQMAAEQPTAQRSARVALAEAYLRLGNTTAADVARLRADESPADVPWHDSFLAEAQTFRTGLQPRIDQALELLANGQVNESQALIAEVLQAHPDSDEAHLTLAKVWIRAGAFADAERELHQALQCNPNLVEGHFLLAGAQLQRGNYAAAERSYLRTIALRPAYGLAHYNLGDCRRQQGQRGAALDAFRAAVRYRPDLAVAHLELGALLLESDRVEEAIGYLENAVRLDARNDRARNLLKQARARKKS
jgi:tetratricopeptide (TPR) repeat protein